MSSNFLFNDARDVLAKRQTSITLTIKEGLLCSLHTLTKHKKLVTSKPLLEQQPQHTCKAQHGNPT